MIESPDKLSVYSRIGEQDAGMPHCLCGNCKFCNARGAGMIAMDYLLSFIKERLPNLKLATKIVSFILSPGEDDISGLIEKLKRDFDGTTVALMLEAAGEFRKCETMEEAVAVKERFPFPSKVLIIAEAKTSLKA